MSIYIEERTYYPTGCERDDWNARPFAVKVEYRGGGKWAVTRYGNQLSQTGKWLSHPSKMNAMRWCRFDFATACEKAELQVDAVKVNGRTWAEWSTS